MEYRGVVKLVAFSLISHLAGCLLSARVARWPDKLPVWLERDVICSDKLEPL